VKVLLVQTSPNTDGLTGSMALRAMEGAESQGAQTELVHLCRLRIGACQACDNGWGRCAREGLCSQEDAFQGLRDRMHAAQAFVLSTPVYFGEVSESAKSFLDRLRRCEWFIRDTSPLRRVPAVGIAAAGGSGGGTVSAMADLERYFSHLHMPLFDLLPVTQRSREYQLQSAFAAGAALVAYARRQFGG